MNRSKQPAVRFGIPFTLQPKGIPSKMEIGNNITGRPVLNIQEFALAHQDSTNSKGAAAPIQIDSQNLIIGLERVNSNQKVPSPIKTSNKENNSLSKVSEFVSKENFQKSRYLGINSESRFEIQNNDSNLKGDFLF